MSDLLLPNGRHVVGPAAQEPIEERLLRLEMAAGLMAQILQSANLPPLMKQALATFAMNIAREQQQRDKH